MFSFMNEAHAALDSGERPGPQTLSAWEKVEGILGVTSQVRSMVVEAHREEGAAGTLAATEPATLAESPPADAVAAEEWARQWASVRARQKSARNYAEADRIRALLGEHGFQVRDSRDGSIEVVRTALPKA
jgi:cysteinyl-tRNA synthetase